MINRLQAESGARLQVAPGNDCSLLDILDVEC